MKITSELLTAGSRSAGAYTKKQLALLGIDWPPTKGWKASVLGQEISDEAGEEFVRLGTQPKPEKTPVNWCGAVEPVDIHLYILELEHSCFYVGLTSDTEHRFAQHRNGEGAEWTKLHRPIRRLHTINTGTRDGREAEYMEDEVTIALMIRHGIGCVRGGHFSYPDQTLVEHQLRAKGAWERVAKAKHDRAPVDTEDAWSEALDGFLETALVYYDAGSPWKMRETMFSAIYRLSRYRYWHEDFSPALGWEFWGGKGILPVLLSFKLGRTVGSKSTGPFDVLAAAMTRGSLRGYPLRRIFLLTWQAFRPAMTDQQATTLARFMDYLNADTLYDRRFDAFVSVLFPETRSLLRS